MSLTLRSASTSVATTKSAALTHAEMDANWLHLARSAVHTSQYDTQSNYEAARNALTGTTGVAALDIPLTVADGTGITFGPAIDTAGAPDFAIRFLGGTTGGVNPMPYLLGAYFDSRGAFLTGKWVTISNKRVDVNGGIQAVSALADGSEPVMLSVSPDVNGPALGLEGYSTLTGGQANATALAIYDINAIIGGATAYSAGYGTKKFAINGKGDFYWGSNLSDAPETNFSWKLSCNPSGPILTGNTGSTASLTLTSPSGQSSALILNGPASGANESIQWQKNSVGTWQIYQGGGAAPNVDLSFFGPSGRAVIFEADNTLDIGQSGANRPRTGYFGTSLISPFLRTSNGATGAAVNDTVQFYGSDDAAGHTIPSFYCEGTNVIATGQADSASSVRVKIRVNGTVVTLLAI